MAPKMNNSGQDQANNRFALATLYFSMGGPNWNNSTNWLSSNSYCEWHGINCNRLETEVEELDLGENNLIGENGIKLVDSFINDFFNKFQEEALEEAEKFEKFYENMVGS